MIRLPLKYRSDDDDFAPIDYTFVDSIAEGQRQKEARPIHPEKAVVRHRVDPHERVDEYGTHARRSQVVKRAEPRKAAQLPSLEDGPPEAASIAYPPGMAPEEDAVTPAGASPAVRPPLEAAKPMGAPLPEGPLYDAPAAPEIPEWLRVAQHNNLPSDDPIRRRPQVMPAPKEDLPEPPRDMLGRPVHSAGEAVPKIPKKAMAYEDAGYPPELLQEQRRLDADAEARQYQSKRHGAQGAVRYQQEAQEAPKGRPAGEGPGESRPTSYPPPRPAQAYAPREAYPGAEAREEQKVPYGIYEAPYETKDVYPTHEAEAYEAQAQEPQGAPHQGQDAYADLSSYGVDVHPPQEAPPANGGRQGVGRRARAYQQQEEAYQARRVQREQVQGYRRHPEEATFEEGPTPYVDFEQEPYGDPHPDAYASPYGEDTYAPKEYEEPVPRAPRRRDAGRTAPPPRRSPPPRRPAPPRGPYDADVDPYGEEPQGPNIPWLGIGAAVMALVAVLLWILQMSFTTQTETLLRERAEAQASIVENHPYRYREAIETQAQVNNLHPAFIAAIVLNESSFNPTAESSVGARGLMQMMPDTAEWVHEKIARGEDYSFDLMYDPQVNVRYACWYINFLSERFWGDPILVAAAFHAGQGTVQNWLSDSRYSTNSQTIDLEDMMDGPTKNYVTKVQRDYAVYKRLFYEELGV